MWDYRARVIGVHDGDTITAELDRGFADVGTRVLRLLGVYAPELSQPGGAQARTFTSDWIAAHQGTSWPLVVRTTRLKNDSAELTTLARYVATVETIDGSASLNADVIAFLAGHPEWGGGIGAK